MADIFDQVGDVFDQVAKSSGPPANDVAMQAKARLAAGTGGRKPTTPEQVKANPPTATTWQGPFADYGQKTNLKPAPSAPMLQQVAGMGAGMLGSLDNLGRRIGMPASPIRQMLVDPQTGQPRKQFDLNALAQPPAPLPQGSVANVTRDISGATGLPIPDPTNYGMPRMFSDAYDASTKRLESGQSNADMFKLPLAAAAVFGGLKAAGPVGRAILPADIAAERATAFQRQSLGTTPENFTKGATPDVATLQDPQGSVYRSQGRQLKGIQADKTAEYDALEQDMSAPKYQNKISDPMTSINPVLDDAASRATPQEHVKIGEFRSLVLSKVGSLSQGTMQLNPEQLVQLKRWMDGFISTYKDEPIGTVRDMAQNVRKAIKDHLDTVAPESGVRGQRIQSLIQAEDALHDKIYTPPTEPHTSVGAVKRFLDPALPTTLFNTGVAAGYKALSGGLLDRPPIPTGAGAPTPGGGQAPPGGGPLAGGPPTQPNIQGGPPGGAGGGSPRRAPNPATGPSVTQTNAAPPPLTETLLNPAEQAHPTHIEVGQQVSGHDINGTLVSGELKKMYPIFENGVPAWKALILDLKKGRVIELPADQVFSRLEGPPGPKAEPTESGPPTNFKIERLKTPTNIPEDIQKLSSDPKGPMILGQIAQSQYAKAIWSTVPSGSNIIGHGFESVVLETPTQGEVMRIGKVIPGVNERPNIDGVLQPTTSQRFGNWVVEHLPRVKMGVTEAEALQLKNKLATQGYDLYDISDKKAIETNLGKLPDGTPVVVDGGAVIAKKGGQTLASKGAPVTNGPFSTYTPEEFKDAEFDTRNPDNPFQSSSDRQAALGRQQDLRKTNPEGQPPLNPITASEIVERAKSRPAGTPPIVLDNTKPSVRQTVLNTKGEVVQARPEEVALVKDAAAKLAETYPQTIRNVGRIELINDRHINIKDFGGTAPLAYYDDIPGGRISVNVTALRREIEQYGTKAVDATLVHELTHAAQHVLGVKGFHMLGLTNDVEPPAYRNQFKTLGVGDARNGAIPLSPKELKYGPEAWRNGPPGSNLAKDDSEDTPADELEFGKKVNGKIVHENQQVFKNMPIWTMLPKRFQDTAKHTAGASWADGTNRPRGAYGGTLQNNPYMQDFVPLGAVDARASNVDKALEWEKQHAGIAWNPDTPNRVSEKTVQTAGNAATDPSVVTHEFGHGVWINDLTPKEKKQWEQLHEKYWLQLHAARDTPNEDEQLQRIPGAIQRYAGPGASLGWHSFASLFASYILDPKQLKTKYPDIARYMDKISQTTVHQPK